MGEPAVHRGPHGVVGWRCHPDIEFGAQRLQLLPDLRFGLAPDLAAHPAAVATEAERDRSDVAVLGRIEVDRVLTLGPAPPVGLLHGRSSRHIRSLAHWLPYWLPAPSRASLG